MDTFETVISAFCEDAGLALPPVKDGSVDFVVDGLCVSVQYRPDRGDCVMFTLPLYDAEPEPWLMYRALDLGVSVQEFWEMSPRACWMLQQTLISDMERRNKVKEKASSPQKLNYIPR